MAVREDLETSDSYTISLQSFTLLRTFTIAAGTHEVDRDRTTLHIRDMKLQYNQHARIKKEST
eukprot:2114296-Amphidinium_carterae.1